MSVPSTVAAERARRAGGGLLRRLISREPWLAAGFLVLGLPIGTFWFVVLVVLSATGAALTIVWVGVPILALTLVICVAAARAERARVRAFFGEAILTPYRPLAPWSWRPMDWLRRTRELAGDRAVWRDLAYLLLLFPIGIAEFVIAVVAVAVPLGLVLMPAYYWAVVAVAGEGPTFVSTPERSIVIDTLPEALVAAAVGLVVAVPAGWALLGTARGHLALARWLLGPSRQAALEARVGVLTQTRSGAIEAQLLERQRIERDLHDGAQQRLVALAMDLGMAKEKFQSDPEAARVLVEASHEEAKRVLAELRDLVRGIHPAVLTDRGLDAAISAVAARSPVPVGVDVRLGGRLPEAVEVAAYFVVVEALTNVAKHSGAREASVLVRREGGAGTGGGRLVVDVVDNGIGGADAAKGSGLAGLRDRLAALDGRLTVDSPTGGPTWVMAEIPCG